MSTASIRRRVRVEGRVQGVGFRWFCRRVAESTGVAGWVRNDRDGSVCCEVQGEAASVEAFLDQVGKGPRLSRVDEVAADEVALVAGEEGFEVR